MLIDVLAKEPDEICLAEAVDGSDETTTHPTWLAIVRSTISKRSGRHDRAHFVNERAVCDDLPRWWLVGTADVAG